MVKVVGVRFRKACKVCDFSVSDQELKPGDAVVVEVERGLGMGTVASEPVEKDPSKLKHKLKRIIRKADQVDIERQDFNREREDEAFKLCREKIKELNLDMKLIRVEYLFDASKAVFYFTSENRVDFRELVKALASKFHTRIEMKQVGVRDEAKTVGGLGPCGRELCCTQFLSDFAPVTVKMAKEQNLALNPAKISGICGRLMCCLSYEHRDYVNERKAAAMGAAGAAVVEGEPGGHECGGCGAHAKGGEEGASVEKSRPFAKWEDDRPKPVVGMGDDGIKEFINQKREGRPEGGPGGQGGQRRGRRRGRGGRNRGRQGGGGRGQSGRGGQNNPGGQGNSGGTGGQGGGQGSVQ
jgi:cell fate regulator YaaT (PSP1 superfamily)